MQAAVLEDKSRFAIRETPEPVPDSDEVLIRVHCCAMCGSDVHICSEGIGVDPSHESSADIPEG